MKISKTTFCCLLTMAVGFLCIFSASYVPTYAYSSELVLNSEDNSTEMDERGMFGRFYIPSLGINTGLFDGLYADTGLQSICDAEDSAVFWPDSSGTIYIAEHRHQSNMENLKDVIDGETLAYIQQGTEITAYICIDSGIGKNNGSWLSDEDGNDLAYGTYGGYYSPDTAFITYTCTRTKPYIYYAVWVSYENENKEETESESIGFCTEMISVINRVRAKNGLEELVWDDSLAYGTVIRANDLKYSFSHIRPDGSDWSTADSDVLTDEIIAISTDTSDSAFCFYDVYVSWIWDWTSMEKSASGLSSYGAITNSEYKTACCVYYKADDGNVYWVVTFGK